MSDVRRRCVFYVGGFDPKGASHYHALYRDQAARQADAGGLPVEVGPRRRLPSGDSAWDVRAVDGDATVETHYEFLHWDDIVRAHWPRRAWHLWRGIVATTWHNLRCGALWRMWRLSWPAGVALTAPPALLLAAFAGIPLLAVLVAALLHRVSGSWTLALLAALAAAGAAAVLVRRLQARYSMDWLMRSYAFTRLQARGEAAGLEERLDAFASRIAQRVREGTDDEVLVVGHSSGPIMAASALARALDTLAHDAHSTSRPALSFLTLGQCMPILGLLPEAEPFRDELRRLATSPRLDHWIDFSAPPDGCCFALTDPLAACGVGVEDRHADRPKLLSPRFAQMFDPPAYRELKRDKFRMHFQYLMAARKPVDYDYFRITAGARTLRARFAESAGVQDYRELRMNLRRLVPGAR